MQATFPVHTPQSSRVSSTRPASASTQFTNLRYVVPDERLRKTLIFASEWSFYKEGQVEVKERFEVICKEKGVNPVPEVGWVSDKQHFIVYCSSLYVESVQTVFMQVIRDLIREEITNGLVSQHYPPKQQSDTSSDYDSDSGNDHILDRAGDTIPIISNKIQRLDDYLVLHGPGAAISGRVDENIKFPPEIYRLKYKDVWYCQQDLDDVLAGGTFQRLISLTGCLMIKSLNNNRVYVGASSQENVYLAISKLNNLAKYASTYFLSHIFYAEETSIFELSLKPLNEVKIKNKRMFETTLLDTLDGLTDLANNYDSLPRFLTVRCNMYDFRQRTFAPVNIKAEVSYRPDFDEVRPLWHNLDLTSKVATVDPMLYFDASKGNISPHQPSDSVNKPLLDDEIVTITIKPIAFTSSHKQPVDKLRTTGEITTRTFPNTMSQKEPKTKRKAIGIFAGRLELPSNFPLVNKPTVAQPPNDPQPGFVNEVKDSFLGLLKDVQGFRGKLTLEVQFGRVLIQGIRPAYVATSGNKVSLPEDSLKRILQPCADARIPTSSFTQKLTTVPAEATSLTLTKDYSNGSNLWDPVQYKQDAFYHFMYTDNSTGLTIGIEIHAKSSLTDIKIQRDFGHIYVHGTKRAWDYTISLSGAEVSEDLMERYTELSTMLKKTLSITPGLTHPELYVKVDYNIDLQFSLISVRLYKVNLHYSPDKNSILKLTEVLDLDLFILKNKAKDTVLIRARYNDPNASDPDKNRRWFTAGIQSTKANEILTQNETLGLGDQAEWVSQSFEGVNVLDDLYLPASAMLKVMDGVGYHNNNGIKDPAAVFAPVIPPLPDRNSFW